MNIVEKLRLASAIFIAAVCAGAAAAADLPTGYRPPAAALAPVSTWTGFYIGGNLGSGFDRGKSGISATTTDPTLAPALAALLAAGSYPGLLSPSGKGVIGGGQVGYNWQLATQALIGLEADFQGSGIKGSADQIMSPVFDMTTTDVSKSIEWFGTVRGRVGYLVAPQWLLYATGGFAYGQTKTSFSTTDLTVGCVPGPGGTLCGAGASSNLRTGWTAGGGVEAQLTPNWSIKGEYLYVDLGASTSSIPMSTIPAIVFSMSTAFREQIARVGFNYRFDWGGPVVSRY